mmetsp:Transcript_66166/g.156270  ORF Transcript_66166/g.156270 Transcript_66166/m.156270 type:complete len:203 (+) Transcript_66166:146-754(+)
MIDHSSVGKVNDETDDGRVSRRLSRGNVSQAAFKGRNGVVVAPGLLLAERHVAQRAVVLRVLGSQGRGRCIMRPCSGRSGLVKTAQITKHQGHVAHRLQSLLGHRASTLPRDVYRLGQGRQSALGLAHAPASNGDGGEAARDFRVASAVGRSVVWQLLLVLSEGLFRLPHIEQSRGDVISRLQVQLMSRREVSIPYRGDAAI